MFATSRRVVRWGKRGAGWFRCPRCRQMADNATAGQVARPGATKGVWWCHECASELADPKEVTMADPVAQPGPHPHEADDIRRNAGMVAGWSDPMEGFKDDDEPNPEVTQTQA